jgi:hypothetical protein
MFVKQWAIGLAKADIGELLTNGADHLKYHWLPISEDTRFFADPFIFPNTDGNLNVIYEDFSYYGQYGKISLSTVDKDFNLLASKEVLDTGSHLSYPNVFVQDGKTFIMPEASKAGNLYCYEFDFAAQKLGNRRTIIENVPLLDSTILYHNNKYWLFATHRGPDSNNKLYIYHSPDWFGPYTPHQANPVKNNLDGSRPAGNFIKSNGEIYRPTQNSKDYYGKSITLFKIARLDEKQFEEEAVLDIKPSKNSNFNYAIHTINLSGDVIVIDGLRRLFKPLEQLKIFLNAKSRPHEIN